MIFQTCVYNSIKNIKLRLFLKNDKTYELGILNGDYSNALEVQQEVD